MIFLLQHLLIDSANKYPDKEAVVSGEEKITYRDLDENTNKLASVLKENGVKRGDRVGIYLHKSIQAVISIHGVLKSGAIYVPLDPYAPPSRLDYIIKNCGIKCLLTSASKREVLTKIFSEVNPVEFVILTDNVGITGEKVLPVKTISWMDIIDRKETTPPENSAIETDLAYILYTSGSTGTPKGVMISHLNAMTFINWAYDAFRIISEDRLSNHAPLHFDLSIFDIFVAFKAGATLVLVPDGISLFPVTLADWIESNRISVWYSVPSVLSMLVLHGRLDRHRFQKLRAILFAGEVFPVKYLRTLMSLIPHADYYNLYGPTETNVITCYKVREIPSDQIKPIPIGKACANTEVFALKDDDTMVTRPGEVGELYARGSCVAQGYWGDPEKTRRSFSINPLRSYFQEKIYRTGDLVTLDEEDNYIYTGRIDNMIKSRGYRIELGEIESVLYSHPEVREAAVVAIPDEVIGNRIKAFVVLQNKQSVDSSELRIFCSERIPKYMIPEMIEFRESLPKTSTGKIDKKDLVK